MSMSMTKALHTAAQHISQPAGCGTTWRLYGPSRAHAYGGGTCAQ